MSEYYKTKESVEEYIRLAKDVSGEQLIKKLENYLSAQSNILEIGSGPGTDWRILNKKYNVIGSDNSDEFLVHLRKKNPQGEFIKLDATTLDTKLIFDAVYSNKVLHHLNDKELKESIKNQHRILNDNGIICHSFWKGEGSQTFKGMFVNYHNTENLKLYFAKDFEIILIEEYQEFEENDSLLLIGRKK